MRLAPSSCAASSSSFGMARRNGTRMMIVTGSANATCGMITPRNVPCRPRSRSRMLSGRAATVSGNMSPAENRVYSHWRPRNS